jgi:hypothetical protein
MPRRRAASDPAVPSEPGDATVPGGPRATPDPPDPALDGIGVVGITRRRVAWLLAAIVATWIVIVFARQVGEAQAASARADAIAVQNTALAADVSALQRELDTIQQPAFVAQQAAANGLGRPAERPFRLAAGAPSLGPDAPGSAEVSLGARERAPTPLESWLSLLFGDGAPR